MQLFACLVGGAVTDSDREALFGEAGGGWFTPAQRKKSIETNERNGWANLQAARKTNEQNGWAAQRLHIQAESK